MRPPPVLCATYYINLLLLILHYLSFSLALRPSAGYGLLIREVSRSHTTVGRTPLHEWSALRRDLWQHTTFTRYRHTCARRDSNPQFQQASDGRPTPWPRGH